MPLKHTDHVRRPGAGEATSTADAASWETRLLALNALVEVARQHAVAEDAARDDGYRLERALSAVNRAVTAPAPADADPLGDAVKHLGETLAGLGGASEHRR